MRLFVGILLFITCVAIGYLYAGKYGKVTKFFNDFLSFNNKLRLEIGFTKTPIIQIANSLEDNGDFNKCLKNKITSGKFDFKEKYLKSDEIEFLKIYLNNLDSGDINSQLKYLEEISLNLEKKLSSAKEEQKRYSALSIKLAFLIGLSALIIVL